VKEDGTPAHAAIDSVDSAMLSDLMKAGRVTLVEGDAQEILPGITVYTGGKHTYASQYAGVRTAKGTVVVASDNCYLYENLEHHRPIAQTLDSTSNLAAQDRMQRLASDRRLIVPGHDPAVFKRFRSVAPGVAKIE
jgi:glyoxylase-like metal-dependent hydrolase (beta-lactamase superfamily II)